MRIIVALVMSLLLTTGFSQESTQQINEQVWKPFIKTFNEFDTEGFLALHSRDVVRSPRDGKVIWNWEQYYQNHARGDQRSKTNQQKRNLDLRFTERLANGDHAVEVGIYKTTVIRNGSPTSFYGRFHVVLRKEEGTWKILVDTDSSENGTITEQDFLEAMPME